MEKLEKRALNIFEKYKDVSDVNKGKVLPLEKSNDVLRMRLVEADLFYTVSIKELKIVNFITKQTIEKENFLEDFSNLEQVFEKFKTLTRSKYSYSLDNLKQAIKSSI